MGIFRLSLLQKIVNIALNSQKEICGNVSVGKGTHVGPHTVIHASDSITIGENVSIAPFCYIIDSDHKIDGITNNGHPISTSPIKIGNGVWIGTHSVILKGVTIGDGAVVGAGSVVTRDIPPMEVWAGNPARKIRSI